MVEYMRIRSIKHAEKGGYNFMRSEFKKRGTLKIGMKRYIIYTFKLYYNFSIHQQKIIIHFDLSFMKRK